MKRPKDISMNDNMLADIYTQIIALPNKVRNGICKECGFSLPTIYRKMRMEDQIDENGNVISALSNAEKRMILSVADQELKELLEYMNIYRRKDGR